MKFYAMKCPKCRFLMATPHEHPKCPECNTIMKEVKEGSDDYKELDNIVRKVIFR